MAKILTCLVIIVASYLHHGHAEQNILEQGKLAIVGAIAKAKEIADRGVSVQSERQQSYDVFGMKFDTSNGVGTGFGDAVTQKNLNSFEDDLNRRRKRTLGVLDSLRKAGLFNSNSAVGTNVNIVKINSVSNVNNYGPTTIAEVTTESAKRRRWLTGDKPHVMVYDEIDRKVSYSTSDIQRDKDGKFHTHTEGGANSNHLVEVVQNEIDGPVVRNRRSVQVNPDKENAKLNYLFDDDTDKKIGPLRIKRALVLSYLKSKMSYFTSDQEVKSDGSMKAHTAAGSDEQTMSKISEQPSLDDGHRAKRSPQDMDTDVITTEPPFRNDTRGPPRGGCDRGGRGGRGGGRGNGGEGGGGGAGGGRRGPGGPGRSQGRGPPPPPSEEDYDDDRENRRKREADDENKSGSSYYSDSSSSEETSPQRRKKRAINANSNGGNLADSDSSDISSSSLYDGSFSMESSESSSDEDEDSYPNTGGETTQDDAQRVRRSPCKGRNPATTLAPEDLQRRKREAESHSEEEGDEGNGKVERDVSFLTDVMEKFFKAMKKVADTARQVFSGGRREVESSNPDAERI
ncbi:uncharacterized protein LOC134216325 isoform X2 [Armigeres subalbatus]|uniref:uncharacterized protein LOC134216325 isoform X2 n=1 Tax=Armigeres subalbatus TaxID=124917 RepID=UPI002ED0DF6D